MTKIITAEGEDDLLSRGYSRRQMMRGAMMFGGAAGADRVQSGNRLRAGGRQDEHRTPNFASGPE